MLFQATSQLFLQAPKQADDQLPVSQDGGILDIHMTTFLTGIDSLVTAGRSNAPTRVLVPMKSIINAVSLIVDDVRAFEKRPPRDRSDIDVDVLRSLRERAESTLSNLVAASKTHATSSGMSPVSLLDAAASHVSLTMTELAKTVFLRRATRAEQEQFASSSPIPNSSSSGFSPSLRSVDEMSNGHQRKPSSGPTARFADSPLGRGNTRRQAPTSDNSSSETTNSPPPIFDKPSLRADTTNNDEPVASDGIEDNWAELKVRFLRLLLPWLMLIISSVAIPRSTDRIHRLCNSGGAIRRSESYPIANSERELDTDHHHCFQHRCCVQGQFTLRHRPAGDRDSSGAERTCYEAERSTEFAGSYEGKSADDGQVEFRSCECDERIDETVMLFLFLVIPSPFRSSWFEICYSFVDVLLLYCIPYESLFYGQL